jgi:hypothetical protein
VCWLTLKSFLQTDSKRLQILSATVSAISRQGQIFNGLTPPNSRLILGWRRPTLKLEIPRLELKTKKTEYLQKFFTSIFEVLHVTVSTAHHRKTRWLLLKRSPDKLCSRGRPFCVLWLFDVFLGVFSQTARESRFRSVFYLRPLLRTFYCQRPCSRDLWAEFRPVDAAQLSVH